MQRVTRRLAAGLAANGVAITPVGWNARSRSIECRPTRAEPHPFGSAEGATLFVPEIPLALAREDLDPVQLGRAYGMRTVALVHDLIPIKLCADYPAAATNLYRRYFRQFASADLVLATTRYVADDLRRYLDTMSLPVPRLEIVPLPAEFPACPRRMTRLPARAPGAALRLVAVTTWEPRKNLPRLLRALRSLSDDPDTRIALDLVGRRGAFPKHDTEVAALAREIPGVTIHDTLSDAALAALYESCHASVYPSYEEGFGLPIGESLWLGRPCLCHDGSAMAETATGGGTLQIDMTDEAALAAALGRLATETNLLARLAFEAAARPLRTWDAFARDVARLLDE